MTHPENTSNLEFTLRSTILDRPRKLILNPQYIEFDDQNKASEPPTRFLIGEIEAFRYGVKAIRGYRFRIGRIYSIDIRDTSGRIIKLRLKSIYRVRVKQLNKKYTAIINSVYQTYFHPLTLTHYEQFQAGRDVEILGVSINKDGVLYDPKVARISWDFVNLKRYWHYYTLYSEEMPDRYRAFTPAEQWNASILRQLIQMILKDKFPQRKTEDQS